MKTKLILSTFVLLATGSCTARIWNLDECISCALSGNRQIKEQRLDSRILKTRVTAGFLNLLPVASISAGDSFGWEKMFAGNNSPTFSIEGNLTVFQGLAKHWQCRIEHISYDISLLEELGLEDDVTVQTIESYLRLAQSYQQLEYARSGFQASQAEAERTSILVENGMQPLSAEYQIEAQLSSDRSVLVEAECSVRSLTLELCQLMDIPYSDDFRIYCPSFEEGQIEKPAALSHDRLRAAALNSPRYLQSVKKIEQSEYIKFESIAGLTPRVSLTASYAAALGPGHRQLGNSLGISISIPICESWQAASKVKEARLGIAKARNQAENTVKEIEAMLEKAVIETGNYYGKSVSARDKLKAAEELMNASALKYGQGLLSATDYLLAKNELTRARTDFLNARWQYNFHLRIIEYYLSRYENR